MPTVYVGREVYKVDDNLYQDFLTDLVAGSVDLGEYLANLSHSYRHDLSKYIAFRLAEVDQGYVSAG